MTNEESEEVEITNMKSSEDVTSSSQKEDEISLSEIESTRRQTATATDNKIDSNIKTTIQAQEPDTDFDESFVHNTSHVLTFRDCLSYHPELLHLESNQILVKQLALDDGVVSNDVKLQDYKFYIHFLLQFGPIGAAVTLYWRGMWTVLDLHLYPNDPVQSAWASLLIGIATGILCHAMGAWYTKKESEGQEKTSMGRDSPQQSLLSYGIQERCFSFIVGFGACSYWRGVWLLWDELVLTENAVIQNWICLLVGTVVLFALRSFRSVFAPPMVYMPDDADDLDGLTLELCDDLWCEPASAMHQRRALNQRHFLRVANLLEWKKVQQGSIELDKSSHKKLRPKQTSVESV